MGARSQNSSEEQVTGAGRADEIVELPMLQRRSTNDVVIGCIAWSQTQRDDARWMSTFDLARSIALVRGKRKRLGCDLLLCSGVVVEKHDGNFRSDKLLEASGGVPLLNEWSCGDDQSSWFLSRKLRQDPTLFRQQQHIIEIDPPTSERKLLLSELSRGLGQLKFKDDDRTFVLLICGEIRLLNATNRGPVVPIPRRTHVPTVFTNEWVLLHASHRPYRSDGARSGWQIVGGPDPILCRVTADRSTFRSDTTTPSAAVHAGSWEPADRAQAQVAVSAYASGRRRDPSCDTRLEGLVQVRYAEFTL